MHDMEAKENVGKWKKHIIRQLNGERSQVEIPAESQIVNDAEVKVNIQAPVMTYIPEKDRILIMATECIISSNNTDTKPSLIYNSLLMTSDDGGVSWESNYPVVDEEGTPRIHWVDSLENLGEGNVIFHSSDANALGTGEASLIWFSSDFGTTWDKCLPFSKEDDNDEIYFWGDGIYVDKQLMPDGSKLVIASGYSIKGSYDEGAKSRSVLRFSFDSCKTWSSLFFVPEWYGFNEVSVIRAANGDLIAALRTGYPEKFKKIVNDNYSGMGTSFSTDGGYSWSEVQLIYEWGRHFSSMVLLANGDIVMTYVVRRGYPETKEGSPQFGIEAVVSYDNGRTWDLDHRYILMDWQGKNKGPISWLYGCQSTTTVLLPDDNLLTTFSYGPESEPDPNHPKIGANYDIGLVRWKLNTQESSDDNLISSSPVYSDIRNKANNRPQIENVESWRMINSNIAIKESGADVHASQCDRDPVNILYDRYTRQYITLETIPAWIEIKWPEEHLINEIHIHPGAPSYSSQPETECIPLDYRLQYSADGEWIDIITPIVNAKRYDKSIPFMLAKEEFEDIYKFSPLMVKAIRIYITRSSDTGKRRVFDDRIVVPEEKRKTVMRLIEVMEAR